MLRLENLTVRLGSFQLFGIDLHVRQGEYRVVLGSTGTGKTVLLETVAGLHRPCDGRIFLRGKDITGLVPEKRNLGIVYQDYALFPHMSVKDNIAFGLRIRGTAERRIREDVLQIADFLDLHHILERTPGNLSGGERQRTALARALVLKPHMLLLDEPLSALDRLTRDRLRSELKRIHRNLGLTVLHITHDLSEAFLLADMLAVMKNGRVLQEGPPEQVLARPASRFAAELLGISSFIPAEVDSAGMVNMAGLCSVPAAVFSPPPDMSCGPILITVPDWTVEVGTANQRQLLWDGSALLKGLEYSGNHITALLELPGGTEIRAMVSRREIGDISCSFERGTSVACRIMRRGTHWVLRE
jgi:ABC-type sugar transport system ATPase subunit